MTKIGAGHNQTLSSSLTSSGTVDLGDDQVASFGGTATSAAAGAGGVSQSTAGSNLAADAADPSPFDEIDFAVNGDAVHQDYGFDGAGITIGIISDSFDSVSGDFAKAVAAGLVDPNAVDAKDDDALKSDEGLAMAEIIHQIAPDAHIVFYTGEDLNSGTQTTVQENDALATAVTQLATTYGCNIICNDLFEANEPFYQPGFPSDSAITAAVNGGVAFFELADNAAAGFYASQDNLAANDYGFTYHLTIDYDGPTNGDTYLAYNFGTASAQTPFEMVKVSQQLVNSAIQWEQPWKTIDGTVGTNYGVNYLIFADDNGEPGALLGWGEGDGADDAINYDLTLGKGTYFMAVVLTASPGVGNTPNGGNSFGSPGSLNSIPNGEGLWKVIMNTNGGTGVTFLTEAGDTDPHADIGSGTIWGDEEDPSAITVGAVDYTTTPAITGTDSTIANESYSGTGPGKYFFTETGAPINAPDGITLDKVNISAPDGGDTNVDDNASGGDNFTASGAGSEGGFFGTSAATPAAAAIGALLLQADPTLTPNDIETILEKTAIPFGTADRAGAGLVNALAAVRFAVTPTWTVAVSGNFATAGNWNTATVPDANDNAEITPSGTYTVSSTVDETVKSLTMATGATLDLAAGTFTITTSAANPGTIVAQTGADLVLEGEVNNSGELEALGGAIFDSATITGAGAFTISGGGQATIASGETDTGMKIDSGGTGIVLSHGKELAAQISGGVQNVSGYASGATIFAGGQNVLAGGTALGTTISNGAVQDVDFAGTASATNIDNGGGQLVFDGGKATATTIKSAASETIAAGGTDVGALISGGTQFDYGSASGATVFTGSQVIETGANASGTTVKAGGVLAIEVGGAAVSAAVGSGGLEVVSGGGTAGGSVASGGTFEWVGSDQVTSAMIFHAGAILELGSGSVASNGVFSAGPTWKVLSGGTGSGGQILSGGVVDILSGGRANAVTVSSGGKTVVSSGGSAIDITISAGGTEIVSSGGTDISATVDKAGLLEVLAGGVANDATVGSGGTATATSGTLTLSGGTIGAGGIVEAATSGTVFVSGSVANSGTLFASGAYSLVQIASGAVVNGGVAKVCNGIVDIQGASSENVAFQSAGTGGLQLDDAVAYGGTVSGFGQNTHQFIDLADVASSGATLSYVSNTSNTGVLTVSSGGAAVAEINLVGKYATSNFHISAGISGSAEIIDPPLVAGGAQSPNLALFGNYIAASFVADEGHGGTFITDALQSTHQQSQLSNPHA